MRSLRQRSTRNKWFLLQLSSFFCESGLVQDVFCVEGHRVYDFHTHWCVLNRESRTCEAAGIPGRFVAAKRFPYTKFWHSEKKFPSFSKLAIDALLGPLPDFVCASRTSLCPAKRRICVALLRSWDANPPSKTTTTANHSASVFPSAKLHVLPRSLVKFTVHLLFPDASFDAHPQLNKAALKLVKRLRHWGKYPFPFKNSVFVIQGKVCRISVRLPLPRHSISSLRRTPPPV